MAFANDSKCCRKSTTQIFVVGRAGVGKTTLINRLFTDRAKNVNGKQQMVDRVSLTERQHQLYTSIDPPLTECQLIKGDDRIQFTVEEIDLTVSAACLALLRSNISRAESKRRDLIIYCTRMDETRYLNDDILLVTKLFGREVWENAIIALTFANRVAVDNPYGKRSVDEKKFFDEEYQSWVETLFSSLRKQARVDSTLIQEIPILPTGSGQKLSLPTIKNWVSSFVTQLWHVLLRQNERLKRINVSDEESAGSLVWRGIAAAQGLVKSFFEVVFGYKVFAEKDEVLHTHTE